MADERLELARAETLSIRPPRVGSLLPHPFAQHVDM